MEVDYPVEVRSSSGSKLMMEECGEMRWDGGEAWTNGTADRLATAVDTLDVGAVVSTLLLLTMDNADVCE